MISKLLQFTFNCCSHKMCIKHVGHHVSITIRLCLCWVHKLIKCKPWMQHKPLWIKVNISIMLWLVQMPPLTKKHIAYPTSPSVAFLFRNITRVKEKFSLKMQEIYHTLILLLVDFYFLEFFFTDVMQKTKSYTEKKQKTKKRHKKECIKKFSCLFICFYFHKCTKLDIHYCLKV